MNLAEQVEHSLVALKNPALMQNLLVQDQIMQFLMLIEKWNKRYNLTAVKAIDDMLYQHIIDSLSIVDHLYGPVIVDVGTGAGLPGIPLAIAQPNWQVILIESNQKKAVFLQQVKIELKLDNITVMARRIENTSIEKKINTIVCRAYASLGTFIQSSRHLVSPQDNQCRWVAMKGNCTMEELTEVTNPFFVENTVPLIVPGLSAKRELIIIRQSTKPTEADRE